MRIQKTILLLLLKSTLAAQTPANIPELLSRIPGAADSSRVNFYSSLAFLYMTQDKYDSAIYYTSLTVPICEKLNNISGLGDAYNNMGTIYRMSGQKEKAMENLLRALALFEKNNMYKRIAKALGNIAYIYAQQLNFEKAASTLLQAVPNSIKAKDTLTLVDVYTSLAENYSYLKKPVEARDFIQKGQQLVDEFAKRSSATSMDSLKFIYAKSSLTKMSAVVSNLEGNYKQAIAIFLHELETTGSAGMDDLNTFDIYSGLGHSYMHAGRYDSALLYTLKAETFLSKGITPIGFENLYELKAQLYEKTGHYQDAYASFKRFKYLSDSINSDKATQTLADMRTKYETEKKDTEIHELNLQKRSQNIITAFSLAGALIAVGLLFLAWRSARLQKKLFKQKEDILIKEKEIETNELEKKMMNLEQMALRAQMNPHFIFNSLNAVQHFVMNRDVEGVNNYLGAFARLVRQTLDNAGKQLVTLDEEVRYLDTYLSLEKMKSFNGFNYEIEVYDAIDCYVTLIPGMILQPFVENSIRHGVAQKENRNGLVKVVFSKNQKLVCIIEDNGIGRVKAAEIKSETGDNGFESKGMSITMSRILAINKMYNTDITIQVDDLTDNEGGPAGTRVKVEFPPDME